jgi:hypothetical protein
MNLRELELSAVSNFGLGDNQLQARHSEGLRWRRPGPRSLGPAWTQHRKQAAREGEWLAGRGDSSKAGS